MSLRSRSLLANLLLAAWAGCAISPAGAVDGGATFLRDLSLSTEASPILTICHGFNCAQRHQLVLTPARLASIGSSLGKARSAKDERKALAKVVAWFDRESGKVAGTVNRIAYASATTKSGPAQMDCIDLTANITELLRLFERNKLMKFHEVGEPVSRGFIIDGKQPHTTPVIVETAGGGQWSVDSWTHAYGEAPDIFTIAEWKNRK
jgi:hypothetical protein